VLVKIKLDAIKNFISDLSKQLIKTIFCFYTKPPLRARKGEKWHLILRRNKKFVKGTRGHLHSTYIPHTHTKCPSTKRVLPPDPPLEKNSVG
jgi:hypothetical protein